ncbi:MAG TPA: DUF2306 domain-containing protein [Caulobacteraceae bacterium]|nr:DUF2306 domain-containing protein [Caulobacteraceae bacterium]
MAVFRRIGFVVMALLAAAIALVSFRYLAPGAPGGAPPILANAFTRYGALTVHAGFAATALLIGWAQFLAPVRRRWPKVHRWTGRVYVAACLVAGLAGLALAVGTTAGPAATVGFGVLAIVWSAATAQAWRLARRRDFVQHERWMIRSYALTLAAVTLRLYMPAAQVLGLDMAVAYPAISFLCWIPNLAIAELTLAGRLRTSPPRAAPLRSPG